jgi:hypothetical protein
MTPAARAAARFLTPQEGAAADRGARGRRAARRRVGQRRAVWADCRRWVERRQQRQAGRADHRRQVEPRPWRRAGPVAYRPPVEQPPQPRAVQPDYQRQGERRPRREVEPAGPQGAGRREASRGTRARRVARLGMAGLMFRCPVTPIGLLIRGRAARPRAGRQREAQAERSWRTQGSCLTQPCLRMPGLAFRRTSEPGALVAPGRVERAAL